MQVEAVLDTPDDACLPWIDKVYGRAVRVGSSGGSLWSRKTEYGTGLCTTAAHVLTPCSAGVDCPDTLYDPKRVGGAADFRLTELGGVYASLRSAHFPIFSPATPAEQLDSPNILPRYDVSVYAVDSQTFQTWGYQESIFVESIVDAPVELYDPENLTQAPSTWAPASPGARVVVVGYAPDPIAAWPIELLASVAHVLTDAQASHAIELLKEAGDEEGDIPYDAGVEFLLEGQVAPEMGGSGVFDEQGRQLGVLVRGTPAAGDNQYLRVVRMSYLVERINETFRGLPEEDQAAVAPYLERP